MISSPDIPSPIDLRSLQDAAEWESTAMEKRPWRMAFFDVFASEIAQHSEKTKVLELGSGPGFLAAHLLAKLPQLKLHLLDFSEAMHSLAQARLGAKASSVQHLVRSFRDPDWSADLGNFDCVITHQAVHELRHKRHAVGLHRVVSALLRPQGSYLVCDHYAGDDGMRNDQLYMTIPEQKAALLDAGFSEVNQLLATRGLVLHRATI
jgi:ubiquinone/menaquinone biosynthesis C-methylase UbiE